MQNADFTATAVHYAVENEAREAIRKIDGTMPEDLPTPEKSIAQLEKEQMQRLKQKAISSQGQEKIALTQTNVNSNKNC